MKMKGKEFREKGQEKAHYAGKDQEVGKRGQEGSKRREVTGSCKMQLSFPLAKGELGWSFPISAHSHSVASQTSISFILFSYLLPPFKFFPINVLLINCIQYIAYMYIHYRDISTCGLSVACYCSEDQTHLSETSRCWLLKVACI